MRRKSPSAEAHDGRPSPKAPILIVKGLDIPIAGEPDQAVTKGATVSSVALLGADYIGLQPAMRVAEGDRVKLGQPLFAVRRHPEILFTAPGSGVVRQINRGARRALLSVVIELDGDEEETFGSRSGKRLAGLGRGKAVETLLASGLWTALRTRPYNTVPPPASVPSSIFVTAMDSNPLAARAEAVIELHREDFANGLTVLSRLTEGPVFVCHAPGADLPSGAADSATKVAFAGPHPAGLAGTHIHSLDPVGPAKTVWHVGYQDAIAIGRLFTTGRLWVERVVALAGPAVKSPRLVRTRLGASTDDLTGGELEAGEARIVSGSVLSGRHATGPEAFLGRFHTQLSVLPEGPADRPPARFRGRGQRGFSIYTLFAGRRPKQRFAMSTAAHGAPAALVPLGGFERVMPLDILPTQLLKALLVGDTDTAQALGCLELDEEDLALCSFVCPGKIEYGPLLRANLQQIEKTG